MGLIKVLADLRAAGVTVRPGAGERLILSGAAVPDPLRRAVAEHKAELLQFLQRPALPTLAPRERGGAVPLAYSQQRLWFLEQLNPGTATYNLAVHWRLEGELSQARLAAALGEVLRQHEILRTRFVLTADAPEQVIDDQPAPPLHWVDASDWTPAAVDDALRAQACKPFRLDAEPALRVVCLRTATSAWRLLVVAHHLIFDLASAQLFVRELAGEYAGRPPARGAPPLQYADFAIWQRAALQASGTETLARYWEETLRDCPRQLALPRQGEPQADGGGWVTRELAAETMTALEEFASRHSCSEQVPVLAAWQWLLSIYSDTEDVVTGMPVDLRDQAGLDSVIGFFLNTLVLRTQVSGVLTFANLADAVNTTVISAHAHRDLPFELLVERLQPERSLDRTPLVQTFFSWVRVAAAKVDWPDVEIGPPTVQGTGTAKFDWSLLVERHAQRVVLGFEYAQSVFTAAAAQRALELLEHLLRSGLAQPEQQLAELPLLPAGHDAARAALSGLSPAPATTVPALVAAQAERTPAAVALRAPGVEYTYARLEEQANRLAHGLLSRECGRGGRVGVLLERGAYFPLALLAILKTGAAYVPLDAGLPAGRLRAMLAAARVTGVVTATEVVAGLQPDVLAAELPVILIDTYPWDDWPGASPAVDVAPADAAYLIFTSGSTGQPKATVLAHRGLANLLVWQAQQPGLGVACPTLHYAALSFDVSFTEPFSTWACGGTLVTVDAETRRDFPALVAYLAEQRIERLFLPTAALEPLARLLQDDSAAELALTDVIVSGEQLRISPAVRAWVARVPALRLHNHYGPAETHVVTAATLVAPAADWPTLPPIGSPVDGVELLLLDRYRRPLPPGVPGELWIGGVAVGLGYFGQPELTAERFVPAAAAGLVYRTGDQCVLLADGTLKFLGRLDAQFKVRGYRIEPGEVEAQLCAQPGIANAVVVARPGPDSVAELLAYVELAKPVQATRAALDRAALRAALSEQLPDYMLPAAIVVLPELPQTATGKLDRRALPDPTGADRGVGSVAAVTPGQERIVSIFAEVLGLETVGAADSFFALGGHSLAGVRVIARLREQLDTAVPLKLLFQYPSAIELDRAVQVLTQARQPHAEADVPDAAAQQIIV